MPRQTNARRQSRKIRKRIGHNPRLAIVNRGAHVVKQVGTVTEIRYKRSIEPGRGKLYKHEYATAVPMIAMSDGTLRVGNSRLRAWEDHE